MREIVKQKCVFADLWPVKQDGDFPDTDQKTREFLRRYVHCKK
jgi:hypothetical protein